MSRLKQRYTKEIAPAMSKEYGYKNVMAIPKLEKIVINIGLGEAIQNSKLLDKAGVTVPTGATMTWDQFADLAKEVEEKTGTPGVGWGLKSPTATVLNLGMNFDGKFFDGTGKDAKATIARSRKLLGNE